MVRYILGLYELEAVPVEDPAPKVHILRFGGNAEVAGLSSRQRSATCSICSLGTISSTL